MTDNDQMPMDMNGNPPNDVPAPMTRFPLCRPAGPVPTGGRTLGPRSSWPWARSAFCPRTTRCSGPAGSRRAWLLHSCCWGSSTTRPTGSSTRQSGSRGTASIRGCWWRRSFWGWALRWGLQPLVPVTQARQTQIQAVPAPGRPYVTERREPMARTGQQIGFLNFGGRREQQQPAPAAPAGPQQADPAVIAALQNHSALLSQIYGTNSQILGYLQAKGALPPAATPAPAVPAPQLYLITPPSTPTPQQGPLYQPVAPRNPLYAPTPPGQPLYAPTPPGQPLYQPVAPGVPLYNPVVPGQPLYAPVAPGASPSTPAIPVARSRRHRRQV